MESQKLLFTPGPLTTSSTVKQAMLRDLGSRDPEFLAVLRDIRRWRSEEYGRHGRPRKRRWHAGHESAA